MGLLKQARENNAVREGEEAQEAWDEGRLAYVHRARSGATADKGLTAQLDHILRVGWRLHSTAMTMNTSGANNEVVVFVFTR